MDEKWTTHHEASHAVVAHRLGWTVRAIVIENFDGGATYAYPPVEPGDWRDDCTIKLAGLVGEQKFRGEADSSDQAKDERMEALQVAACHAPESAEIEVRRCEKRAAVILEEDWSLVTKIASSLQSCDRIEGTALQRLLRGE